MDEIYTDLDNYNDVNLVEELKSENKDLKFKLEEYSSALHRLQKNILQDFDKLSGEFKNLERNYSSLLKTARAEIERKTETIKNLNLEKDQLVIKSLQKGKNILQNRRSNFKDVHQNKNYEVKQNDKESTGKLDNLSQYKTQTSVDVVASFVTENKTNHTENITLKIPNNKLSSEENKERDRKNKTHRNENAHQSESVKKIIDRRKSTNFPECEPTFSSDEDSRKTITEQQQNSSHKDAWQNEKRHDQQDHLNPLPYEHYHQPLQPSYRNRSSRYNEYDRQRTHDHYDTYDKPRRYYSPDNHYRYGKDTSDNYNQRENKRDRRYERSPVTDRYNRAKSRDRRNNFERENYYDHGKKTHHTSDLPAKRPYELEEPSSKRLKIDSYTRHTNIDKEKEFVERHTYTNAQGLQDPSTCQSPDYTHIDSNVHHSVKEIIHTALTPLQDPRLLSNKYILKSNSEKPILMTVAGSNVDIVPITSWGADRSSKATKPNDAKLPSDKGIRNSGQNLSTESGEIHSVNEDQPIEIFPNITELKSDISKNSSGIVDTNQQTASRDVGKSINLYKIPRLKKTGDSKKTNNLKEKSDEPKKLEELGKDFRVIVEGKHLSEKSPENIIDTAKNKTTSAKTRGDKSKSILQKLIDETELSGVPGNINIPETNKLVNISTIEGDLELSDETSDNMDLITEDSMKNEAREGISHGVNNKQIQLSLDKETSNKADDKVKRSKDSRKSSHSRRDSVKEKVRETSKRRRTKKQSDLEECNVLKDKSPPTKENIELEDKLNIFSQTKNKFTDLFGDSNSLITPDDLGLPVVSPLNTGKFDSMFENTQDAVDLSDEQVRTVKALKDIDNTDDAETSKEALIQDAVSNTESKKSNDNRHNDNKPASSSKEEDNPSALIYGNVKADNASDVIKTIIISTGTQPQCVSRDTEFPRGDNVQKQFDFQKGTFSTAIATSTPYKLDSSQISPTVDSTLMPRQFTNNKLDQNDLTSHTTVGSNTNESKIKNDSDVPDVRIFVKRRKKVTKKPA